MINFLHTFIPQAVLLSIGPITIYWYGFFMVVGMLAAILTTIKLAKYYSIQKDVIIDLAFWLIIGGIVGARIYDDILFLPYYINNPSASYKIWQGGLAIHGGIIAGLIIIFFFARKKKINFWKLSALLTPGLALGQAIGRWGNYFNQELFGLPTKLSWGIPISLVNRPLNYFSVKFFHPTFLYESLGNLLIFLVLLLINIYFIRKKRLTTTLFVWITAFYMILYSILRFSLEFIRIDVTPYFFSLRWPQVISLIIIVISILIILLHHYAEKKIKSN